MREVLLAGDRPGRQKEKRMLDFYFISKGRRLQLQRGPLGQYLDGLAGELQRASYSRLTARQVLSIAGQFSHFVGLAGISAQDIDETIAERFLAQTFIGGAHAPNAIRKLLEHLRTLGVIASAPALPPLPFASILDEFDRYMQDVRGLAPTTRTGCVSSARSLVDWLVARYGDRSLARLTGADVLEFISEQLDRGGSRGWRAHVCSQARGFLRYLHASGVIATDVARAVPKVATPRLASLPRAIPWKQVRALIDGVDTSHPDGMRDKVILLLLATLGLRSCEVRSLELGDIKWRSGEIRIPRTKTRRERVLPLLAEVGTALADYVLHGRPLVPVPQVLLRHGPRPGAMKANTIVWILRRHLDRAGIRIARRGAHMLRHSLATRMVNAGVPIKSVADVLGHASIDTTAIYTKVDMTTLATVALPFPRGAV
jgi:site-specific recombinase XerD